MGTWIHGFLKGINHKHSHPEFEIDLLAGCVFRVDSRSTISCPPFKSWFEWSKKVTLINISVNTKDR